MRCKRNVDNIMIVIHSPTFRISLLLSALQHLLPGQPLTLSPCIYSAQASAKNLQGIPAENLSLPPSFLESRPTDSSFCIQELLFLSLDLSEATQLLRLKLPASWTRNSPHVSDPSPHGLTLECPALKYHRLVLLVFQFLKLITWFLVFVLFFCPVL